VADVTDRQVSASRFGARDGRPSWPRDVAEWTPEVFALYLANEAHNHYGFPTIRFEDVPTSDYVGATRSPEDLRFTVVCARDPDTECDDSCVGVYARTGVECPHFDPVSRSFVVSVREVVPDSRAAAVDRLARAMREVDAASRAATALIKDRVPAELPDLDYYASRVDGIVRRAEEARDG
jgi:hypothetical protein